MEELQLRICTLDGQSTTVMVKPQDTIGGLKTLLQEKQQFFPALPLLHFHLFLRGRKLNVEDSIQSLALRDGEFVVIMPYTTKKRAVMVSIQKDSANGREYRVEMAGCAQVAENVGSEATCDRIISRPGETISLKDVTVIANASGFQENLSLPTDHAAKASMDASDSIWNAIVTDMSAWKASVGPDTLANTKPNPAEEYGEQTIRDDPNAVDMGTVVDLSLPSWSKRGAQKLGNHSLSKKNPFDWNGVETIIQGKGLARQTDTSVQNSAEEKQVKASAEQGCFSHIVGDSTNVLHISEPYRQKRARKCWSCPTVLKNQYELFRALNFVYGFLQRQHMQGTWQNMKAAVQKICEGHWQEIQVADLESLAILFPKLIQLSSRVGEGPDSSCTITLLEPSKVPDQSMPRSLHEVMPFELQKGIGPSDVLPSAGGKQISDSLIKSSIQKRQVAFETAVDNLMKQFQESQMSMKSDLKEVVLDELLHFAKKKSKLSSDMVLPRPPRQHKKCVRCLDTTDFSASEMFEHLQQGLGSLGQTVHCEIVEPRKPKYGQLVVTLSDQTMAALGRMNISKLYIHQAEAINAAVSKKNVIVATSTASGKSVCYNIPVLDDLFCNAESCALYLFPTKALAQDQLRALLEMTSGLEPPISIGVYDGDTPQHQRLHFRDHARIVGGSLYTWFLCSLNEEICPWIEES